MSKNWRKNNLEVELGSCSCKLGHKVVIFSGRTEHRAGHPTIWMLHMTRKLVFVGYPVGVWRVSWVCLEVVCKVSYGFLGPQDFLDWKFHLIKSFGHKIIQAQNILDANFFRTQHFWTWNLLRLQIFITQIFCDPKFVTPKNVLDPGFFRT